MLKQEPELNLKNILTTFESIPRILKMLFSTHRLYLIIITICTLIGGIIPAISILTTQLLINTIQTSNNEAFTYVLTPITLYIMVNLVGFIVSQIHNYFQSLYKIELTYRLNLDVLEKAKSLNLKDFEDSDVYDKLRRAQNEITDRPYKVFSLLTNFASQIITLITSSIILIMWRPWIIIPAILIPAISTILMIKIGYLQYKIEFDRAPLKRKSWYYNFLMTNDIAFKEIKLFNIGDHLINGFKELYESFIIQDKTIIKKRTKISFVLEFFDQLISGFIIILIIYSAYLGEILLGSTIAYIKSLSNVKSYTQGILGSVAALYENNLYINQLFEFLDYPVTQDNGQAANIEISKINSIEFKNVSFKYPNRSEYAIKEISFKVSKGENISLVGENGSGKSTLVKLISCFYDNYEGEILINGISLRDINHKSIREKVGVIFQDFNKYELSCRENIGFGKIDVMENNEKINSSLDRACANKIIEELPNGLASQLGVWFEGGVQLSIGQWQRIALARAFLRESDCLIFDEPSSALDPISEYEVFKKSKELIEDRIGIFISHRLFNLRKISSRIIVLHNGQLVEMGTHNELMNKETHYKFLYNLQNEIETNNDVKGGDYVETTA